MDHQGFVLHNGIIVYSERPNFEGDGHLGWRADNAIMVHPTGSVTRMRVKNLFQSSVAFECSIDDAEYQRLLNPKP